MQDVLLAERVGYARSWSNQNAAAFAEAGHYDWMAEAIDGYEKVLEIGTGTGQSTLALAQRGQTIVSVDENPACLALAQGLLQESGIRVTAVAREKVRITRGGYHVDYRYPKGCTSLSGSVLLLEGDFLADTKLEAWLNEEAPFDAIVCWLIGTHQARSGNTALDRLNIGSSGEYRLRVQNRIYQLADKILRPGGILNVVDRGEAPGQDSHLADATLDAHRAQARVTSLVVESVRHRAYVEPTTPDAVKMELTLPLSGRVPSTSELAFQSVVARKPEQ